MARAGKVIYSVTSNAAGNFPDDFPTIDAALCCLGMATAMAGASSAGMELLSRYGEASGKLLGPWVAEVICLASTRSRHWDLAMDIIETWLAAGEEATEAAFICTPA